MEKSRSENDLKTFGKGVPVSYVGDNRGSFDKIRYKVCDIDEEENKYICSYGDGDHVRKFSPCDLVPFSEVEKQCDDFTDDMLKIVQP
jgi:hypothetical protein